MSGILSALNSAKTSLQANQKAIDIIGNNIANVNTEGYSRQVPVFTPIPSLNFRGFNIGLGVSVTDVEREYDSMIVSQIQNKSAGLGELDIKSSPLSEIERIINIGEANLSNEIEQFFSTWQQLSTNPAGSVERESVLVQGQRMLDRFSEMSDDLNNVRNNVNEKLDAKVQDINRLLSELHSINDRIATISASGLTPNAEMDRRDVVLEDLSRTLGVDFFIDEPLATVQLPGGVPLLQDNYQATLSTSFVNGVSEIDVQMGSTTIRLNFDNVGGEIKGLMDVRDNIIPAVLDDVDNLAYTIATEVNTQHQLGMGSDGIGNRDFFNVPATATDVASNLSIALTDVRQVAAGNTAASGDNNNALAMADLANARIVNGTDTFSEFYGRIASKVGMDASQNMLSLEGHEDAIVQLKNQRDAKSGVSIEEEMIRMIQYQRAFEASAKLLTAVDEMMQTLLTTR